MAVLLLEKGLQTYPGDTSLETFLAITRAEMEHMQRESAEREAFRNRNQVQDALVDAPVQEPSEVRGLLQRLRIGLVEKLLSRACGKLPDNSSPWMRIDCLHSISDSIWEVVY